MLTYPQIDPIALSLGPLKVHWYGLMYVIGFMGFLLIGKYRARRSNGAISVEQVDDLMFYGALGVVLGGRIGYMLFYKLGEFANNPLSFFQIWDGGMSFHGGLLGVILVMFLLAKKWNVPFLFVGDFVAPMVPIGLGAGRMGNFINGELWGKPTDVSWGMVFPQADQLVRHPSQLYQFVLEGILLFTLLWYFSKKPRPIASVSGLFLLFYGLFRFLVEFVREPDAHIGYIAWEWLTKGQLLSVPMILIGLALIIWAYRNQSKVTS
jgi:phosphatidylglycerol:prolipoprotein diacylglycerol transferase